MGASSKAVLQLVFEFPSRARTVHSKIPVEISLPLQHLF